MIFPYHSATFIKCVIQSTTPDILLCQVWPLALSLATTRAISFDFSSSSYLDVSVRRVPSTYLCIQYAVTILLIVGLPHSDTCGSILICSSPQLFAACRVLLRLPMPRHSPCTLYSLNFVRNANRSEWFFAFSIVVILPNFNHRLTCFCRFVSLLSRFAFFSPFCFIQFSRYIWWAQVGSNHRPLAYQASALAC